jgi:maleate isomerase
VSREQLVVGVVTPHAAAGPEVELPAMTRGRLTTVVSRTGAALGASQVPSHATPGAHAELRASTEPAALDRASSMFLGIQLAAVAHASTTTGYVIGAQDEAALVDRLSDRFGVPAVSSCAAAVAALKDHGVEHVQLVHPPWFDDEFDELGAAYFLDQGFDALVTKARGLPGDPTRVEPKDVVEWLERHVEDRAEAVFLAGNGFRAAAAVAEVESRTGCLGVTANQALLWGLLSATGTTWDLTGHGRVFRAAGMP